MAKKSIFKSLYLQVLVAIAVGVMLGHFYPETGAAMKPLGDGFIKLIKMIIAPIIFCTIVVGIAGLRHAPPRFDEHAQVARSQPEGRVDPVP